MQYSFEIITNIERVEALRDSWDQLYDRCDFALPQWRHVWLCAWLRSNVKSGDIRVLLIRCSEGKLLAAMPLQVSRESIYGVPVRHLRFASGSITPSSFVLVDNEHPDSLDRLVDGMFSEELDWDIASFINIPKKIAINSSFVERIVRRGSFVLESAGRKSPYVELAGTFDSFMESRSRNFRYQTRRTAKKLESAGSVKVCCFYSKDSIEAHLIEAFDVSKRSWKGPLRTDMAGTVGSRKFYENFWGSEDLECRPALWILYLDEVPIAIQLYLSSKQSLQLLRSDFDEEYSSLGPGSFLTNEVLRDAYALGYGELDFGGMDYSYKRRYAEKVRSHINLEVFRRRLMPRIIYITKMSNRYLRSKTRLRALFNK